MDKRTPRDLETREHETRATSWRPPDLLPTPLNQAGWSFRWIRTSVFGESDATNVSKKFRENWVPARASDHPELQIASDKNSKWPEGIEIGGLLLCKAPAELRQQRKDHYEELARTQLRAMDNSVMKESHPSMPMAKPERRSQTSVGRIDP